MPLPAEFQRQARFGEFVLDLETAELRNNGNKTSLQGQPLQILEVLLERPGKLVTREELKKRLWPSDTFVDFDQSLNRAVNRLREALNDSAEKPRFIETLPRRGYRFIAQVSLAGSNAVVDAAEANHLPSRVDPVLSQAPASDNLWAPELPTGAAHSKWGYGAGVVAAVVIVLAVAAIQSGRVRLSEAAPSRNIQSLAVLPLENLSGNPGQDYFADGMTDQLITSLGQIRSLRVISRTSAMQYRGVHKSLPLIARELQVDAIVEGTVLRSGDKVRITAQLIEASADKHLWAQSYERDLKDVLVLQHEIASAIAKQIRMTLTPGEQIRAGTEHPVNLEAYESYWRGEYFLNRGTPDSIRKAADYFQQAIEKDPNYPAAYTKLAACYQILGNMEADLPMVARAKSLMAKALELDPQFASAHAERGFYLIDYDFDFAAGGSELQRAIELDPNGADGHLGLSGYYAAMSRMQESVQEVQRARELDPLDLIVSESLCTMLYFARRYDEALAQCKANLDLDPGSLSSYTQLGAIYAAKGLDSQAVGAFIRSEKLGGASPAMIAALKAGARGSGLPGFYTAWLQFQRSSIAAGKEDPMKVAAFYSFARDTDKALTWLEKAFKARRPNIIFLGVDPTFDPLRSDPRFPSLLRQIGLPQS
jgi:TolB-like protein/DNA-binding winged helix-turn-helix (wHTH) protein/Tfp pilus assembly protein PilF